MFKFAYYFNMNKSITICYDLLDFLLAFCFVFISHFNLAVPNRRNYPRDECANNICGIWIYYVTLPK